MSATKSQHHAHLQLVSAPRPADHETPRRDTVALAYGVTMERSEITRLASIALDVYRRGTGNDEPTLVDAEAAVTYYLSDEIDRLFDNVRQGYVDVQRMAKEQRKADDAVRNIRDHLGLPDGLPY